MTAWTTGQVVRFKKRTEPCSPVLMGHSFARARSPAWHRYSFKPTPVKKENRVTSTTNMTPPAPFRQEKRCLLSTRSGVTHRTTPHRVSRSGSPHDVRRRRRFAELRPCRAIEPSLAPRRHRPTLRWLGSVTRLGLTQVSHIGGIGVRKTEVELFVGATLLVLTSH